MDIDERYYLVRLARAALYRAVTAGGFSTTTAAVAALSLAQRLCRDLGYTRQTACERFARLWPEPS